MVPARCKTWKCRSCRSAVLMAVKNRIEYGVLTLGRSYFITVTLRVGQGDGLKDARYVGKAWARLLKKLREKSRYKTMAWFKVPELTKKKQPHLHLILGGIGNVNAACTPHTPSHSYSRRWRQKECECLEHEWSKIWQGITGSYVVDATLVKGAGSVAGYMVSEYLQKGMYDHDELEARGFIRRWSASVNWPGGSRIVLAQTAMGGWNYAQWIGGNTSRKGWAHDYAVSSERSRDPLLVRVGTDLAKKMSDRKKRRGLVKFAEGIGEHVPSVSETTRYERDRKRS